MFLLQAHPLMYFLHWANKILFVTETESSSMDWGTTAADDVDWGAPVAPSKNDDLVLNWDEDEEDKGQVKLCFLSP